MTLESMAEQTLAEVDALSRGLMRPAPRWMPVMKPKPVPPRPPEPATELPRYVKGHPSLKSRYFIGPRIPSHLKALKARIFRAQNLEAQRKYHREYMRKYREQIRLTS